MNVFNRAVVVVEILLLVAVLIVAVVVPNTVLERTLYTVQQARDTLGARWPVSYLLFLLVAVAVILLLVLLLWLELRPQPKKQVTLRGVEGARAEMDTASVEQSLQYRISEIPDILKVRPTVRGKRGGVNVVISLETTPEIDVPAKTAEVSQAVRDVVESRMGLKLAGLRVHIKHAAYGKEKAPAPSTAAPPATPWEPVASGTVEPPAPPTMEPPTGPEQ